eukprot:COSAG01_NODE_5490_length_4227_cov_430.424661_2_plen_72_part_00
MGQRVFSVLVTKVRQQRRGLCVCGGGGGRRAGASHTVISWRSQLVLWWAGLRGAIAYGLAKRWDADERIRG